MMPCVNVICFRPGAVVDVTKMSFLRKIFLLESNFMHTTLPWPIFLQNTSGSGVVIDPQDSFAWKDDELDEKLKLLHAQQSSIRPADNFDTSIDKSIGNWSKLPKAPNQDVVLLKKARGTIQNVYLALTHFKLPIVQKMLTR